MRKIEERRGSGTVLLLALATVTAAACTEKLPSGLDDGQVPGSPVTVTLELAWPQFGSNLQVYGGYGRPNQMGSTVVARSFGGVEARALVSFASFPTSAQVRDASNNLVTDTALTFIDAYLVARFDTLASTNTDTVTLALSQTLESWDEATATWTNAQSDLSVVRPWSAPGGGAVLPMRTRTWVRAQGDSVQFFFDSAQIARWRGAPDSVRSGRIDLLSAGHRLSVGFAAVRLVATSARDTDTTLVFTLATTRATYIYDPPASAPSDGFRVGGAPAWRTVLDIALPATLNGPPELCAAAGCPFLLEPRNVTYAGLGLRTRTPPTAFLPTDSVTVDVRSVLSRPALPKSPLGGSVVGPTGSTIPPALFGAGAGTRVDIPITAFVQDFLRGPDESGRPPSNTLAILSTPEPSQFSFAEFFGPGGPNAPVLKLILTASPALELP
ncbi:MAG: hypothetical protein FJ207_13530 [Gemmatimonadetes bacterium]|nr:hypothetical protein [Gemmatimonadota bacterium]